MNQREPTGERVMRSAPAPRGSAFTLPSIRQVVLLLAAPFLLVTLALAPRADAYVYWVGTHGNPGTVESATAIGRANLDGTGVTQDFVVLPRGGGGGLAVGDTHLYWTNPDTGEPVGDIGRANLDGTGANQRLIADVEMSGGGVAVDEEHLYWVSRQSRFDDDAMHFTPRTGAIGRARLDGTGVDENFITGLSFPAGAVAVDSSHVYWTSYSDDPSQFFDSLGPALPSRIGRANLDGTGLEENFIGDALAPLDVAVGDPHLWWTAQPYTKSPEPVDAIWRANLDGTGAENAIGPKNGFNLCGGGIALDDTHVYWADVHFTPQSEAITGIGRARLDGSRVNHGFISEVGDGCGDVAVDALGPLPSSDFSFGKVKNNRRKGTARLTVKVPGPGELRLARNKKVKGKQKGADAAGKKRLPIKPGRKASKRLNKVGKVKVKAKVTYTPDGGEPNTKTKRLKLIKR